ncbi:MAG: cation:proton antiporter family protein [Bacteroidales bacterium]|jgi:predicted Kef-type K+ transport protein|nr:cation:proton antiporter [Bacteroidales bacterium]HOL97611.1 cation:proton antiporter [Bacteroidales bacterium]HPD23302.1 cation:proton antiporter [Bacteroidales bacterium]HRS99026.1 cation:proton antiporter [Bacteroidales bacterium]HRT79903.1 cation:proton antiporter [Bacteroidales bacterium]
MEPIILAVTFLFGLLVKFIGLPPMVGYLGAGFLLSAFGFNSGETLEVISELGINLLLFTIGLKLKVKSFVRKEIWAGTTIQVVLLTIFFSVTFILFSRLGLMFFENLNIKTSLVLAFALSLSSTVFAVKIFEDFGEINSYHGVLALGVLVFQDIFAVIFMFLINNETPSIYIIALPLILIILRVLFLRILKFIGHGELLILFGFMVSLVIGPEIFSFMELGQNMGALVMGLLLSNTKDGDELYEKLINFKDLFLIGFFIKIGLMGVPNFNHLWVAFLIALLINIKVIIDFLVFTRFKVRARTAFFSTLALSNYSEFGLIVAAVSFSTGFLSSDWLIIIALSLSISFLVSTPLNVKGHKIFSFLRSKLKYFETKIRLEYDKTFDIGNAEILVFGMGRIGTSVFDNLEKKYGKRVLAIDFDLTKVEKHQKEGREVLHDDATDLEFWISVKGKHDNASQVKLVILCMGNFQANLIAIDRLKEIGYPGKIAAAASHEDELNILKRLGVHFAYDIYSESGAGFAEHICMHLGNYC